jgi:putative transposase
MAQTPRHPHFDHALPFWVDPTANFFVTVCARQRGLNRFCKPGIGDDALGAAQKYHHAQNWFCSIIVLMPDHVHLMVSMSLEHDLAKTMGLWKRWLWKKHGIDWQPNFFEHRLRREESAGDKGRSIFQNPVRAGLIARAQDWPWTWMPEVA